MASRDKGCTALVPVMVQRRRAGGKQLPAAEQARATKRVEVAVQDLVDAQRSLDAACRALSDVIGANADWRRIRDLSERVKAEYQRLDEVASRDHSWRVPERTSGDGS